jgi:hypothetical protein
MKHALFVLAFLALGMVGCSAEDGATDAEKTAITSIDFQVAFADAQTGGVLEDVEICAAGRDDVPCATSDAQGHVALALPADSELMLRCQSSTHGPAYMTLAIGHEDTNVGKFALLTKTSQNLLLVLSGADDTTDHGGITVNVYTDLEKRDERVAGGAATLFPDTGKPAVYVSDAKLPDPALDAMTLGGPGLFVDIPPGDAVVSFSHPSSVCGPGFGWPTDDSLSLATQVFPGAISNVTFVCPK